MNAKQTEKNALVAVWVRRELRVRMRAVNVNWSEEIRGFIIRRVKSFEKEAGLKQVV